jgi:hypothetical protein
MANSENYLYAETCKKLAEALSDHDQGLTCDTWGLTVAEYLGRWLEDSVRGSIKETTYQSYESLVRTEATPYIDCYGVSDV